MCRGRSSIWLTDSRQETAGGLGDEGGFHQGSAEQDEQVEERQHQRRAGGDLRFEHRGFTLHIHLRR